MRLEWLEDILAVAETGSFSEAAARRRLTQSAFSRRIQSIEDYVGAELFDRSHKPVQLRPATEDQRDRITRLTATLRQLIADLRRSETAAANRIVLASQHALTAALTPVLIEGILVRVPDAYVRLRSANLDDCFALLLARQADIALVYRVPGSEHPVGADYIETLTLGEDRLIPVVAAARRAWLDERLAAGEVPMIAYPHEVFLGQVIDREVQPRLDPDLRLLPRVETALTLAALELAETGIGLAWVPASLAAPRIAAGTLADLTGTLPDTALSVSAVRLAGSTGPAAAVWEELEAVAERA